MYVIAAEGIGIYNRIEGDTIIMASPCENPAKVKRQKTPYQVLMAESKRVGWPEAYREDLTVYDRLSLQTEKPEEFGWVLRRNGTHLIFDKEEWYGNKEYETLRKTRFTIGFLEACINQSEENLFYWFSGGKLKQVSRDFLQQKIDEMKEKIPGGYYR